MKVVKVIPIYPVCLFRSLDCGLVNRNIGVDFSCKPFDITTFQAIFLALFVSVIDLKAKEYTDNHYSQFDQNCEPILAANGVCEVAQDRRIPLQITWESIAKHLMFANAGPL